jgi:predicted Zn-dependent peptidase
MKRQSKKFLLTLLLIIGIGQLFAQVGNYKYVTVPNDPMNTRIYTLDNGLKVFMTVYKAEPRIQTYVVVASGSKCDPIETTGLAHYFEHMMFKGTPNYGTTNWEEEKVLLDQIEELFEKYRTLTDEKERKALYKTIDSISYEASKYFIANEYDKMMSFIGATGTNAFTSYDLTAYQENIPSNQLENWAKIQADRFLEPVLRGFHTELETIYEEKNMTLTNDSRKVFDAMFESLFAVHPYRVPVIGYAEHIKNPSMRNIKAFHQTYYVANNMAIALSGDFNPDEAIKIIDNYFGKLPSRPIPSLDIPEEKPITAPIIKEVLGPDAENLLIGYRLPAAAQVELPILEIFDRILSNSVAGLIDIDLVKKQKVLRASSGSYTLKDYSVYFLMGKPKEGQSLEEVKDLLLQQIERVKKGDFEEWLLQAIVNDVKLERIKQLENNASRAMMFVDAFSLGIPWDKYLETYEILNKVTKKDVIDFANKYFQNNYVVVYKKVGKDPNIQKIAKNKLTPIETNKDEESEFFKKIKETPVPDIAPVFLDFKKDIQFGEYTPDIPIWYIRNTENPTFNLRFVYDIGLENFKELPLAARYIKLLGTDKYSPEEISNEFYRLGISYSINIGEDKTYISISGLTENLPSGIDLVMHLLNNAKSNDTIYKNFINDLAKERTDATKNMMYIISALVSYSLYGENNPMMHTLSTKELSKMNPDDLLAFVKNLPKYSQKIYFYGDISLDELITIMKEHYHVNPPFNTLDNNYKFEIQPTDKNVMYWVNYDIPQSQLFMFSRGPKGYNPKLEPTVALFNEYFGGSMNSIIFQEMRERRALAYTAMSMYQLPPKNDDYAFCLSFIATQYDKMDSAINGFLTLLNNVPRSDNSLQLAKDGIIKSLRTERIIRDDIFFAYELAQDRGIDFDVRQIIFDEVPNLTFDDINNFANQYLKDNKYTYSIIGNKKDLPFKDLKKYGKAKEIKIFKILPN